MAFAGMNYVAIVVAAVAGWLFGAVWYMALSRPWIAALGTTAEALKQRRAAMSKAAAIAPFILSFVAEVIMAWILAGVLGHLGPGQVTIRNGVISGAFLWFGFVMTTIVVNNAFAGRRLSLSLIDAGHWLGVLLVMGAAIGAMGVG